ncbi:MAG TPA: hypothetical protein VFV19_06780 [Candidatus Polarisedimenticolaceae bacterium]|nr:hypothetical protein [Candidatus Polarisedimenticolaceae bacterium]
MKLRSVSILMLVLGLVLTLGSFASADDRPHEGKVTAIDTSQMVMQVQGDKGDQWNLFWTPSTKLKGDLAVEEVKVGDKVHFDFVQKDDKMYLVELKRTEKAKG